MKKFYSLTFILVISAIYTLSCAQNPATEEKKSALGAGIEFDKLTHEFGDIEYKGDGSCEFEFTNTGAEPLILSNVRSSCGCTVPDWPREPISPGEKGVIKVKYDTKRVGNFSKSISVYCNAQEGPIVLRIKGKVAPAAAN